MIKKAIGKITQNFNAKCEFCKKSIKRKHAYFKDVKRLEFVYLKKTIFCNKTCCSKYEKHEINSLKQASLCSSCPVPPGLLAKEKS
tara:strand:- start:1121 stop:1378 length:258 start_codon:yes stop_codon:yes gene_type:complete